MCSCALYLLVKCVQWRAVPFLKSCIWRCCKICLWRAVLSLYVLFSVCCEMCSVEESCPVSISCTYMLVLSRYVLYMLLLWNVLWSCLVPLYPVCAAVVKYAMWRACPVPLCPVDAAVVKYVMWRACPVTLCPVYAAVVKYVLWSCLVPLYPVYAAVVKYVLWRAVL